MTITRNDPPPQPPTTYDILGLTENDIITLMVVLGKIHNDSWMPISMMSDELFNKLRDINRSAVPSPAAFNVVLAGEGVRYDKGIR